MSKIVTRLFDPQCYKNLSDGGLPPVLARIYAARGIHNIQQLETELAQLIPFTQLKNVTQTAALLADAIAAKKRLLIIADYDSDGATACAIGIRILRKFGAVVDYLVPNRFEFGYGLTPEIVRLAHTLKKPDILITVDNGIASIDGVTEANALGMRVLITDHHLPGEALPDAASIINPNQPGCPFPSKSIAGVGVIFYLMLALRAELRNRNAFSASMPEPNLANFLDLVALGTVADVVKLDSNNRILVQQGLQRMRKGQCCAGIHALLQIAKRDYRQISTYELGFIIGPRLNAAGRLDDMSLGIECLITDDEAYAAHIAQQLDTLNGERREIESVMQESALIKLEHLLTRHQTETEAQDNYTISLYDQDWHQGVIGILASRIKDKYHRPAIIFAPGHGDELKGSGRSIQGFHLRDALDWITKKHPGLIIKFGGHAAAAGLTIKQQAFMQFCRAFEQAAQALLSPHDLTHVIETDGDLMLSEINLELAEFLDQQVWGQGFPQPTFMTRFTIESQRTVGGKHSKLRLRKLHTLDRDDHEPPAEATYDAILFFYHDPLPEVIDAVYRVQVNEFNGRRTMQLLLEHWIQVQDSSD
ncbi:single-stranded-DNA-specific exonuclease [Nitrosomonas sp. PY1]|uniref:single-stranded-DNA-specific exonuclease RecJ n=1 Tax=Nitrosomonas sp. PY1 TaxID=1803906 RepID=UPI001FC8049E|nr:single-stranded-DNA-specific exonuclease RecJ [Nitrosomonas sp. PY1]GKS68071.1 single-stranded-DNA-specific exonuclease [Nitrosomonas sp. PY1]